MCCVHKKMPHTFWKCGASNVVPDVELQRASGTINKAYLQSAASRRSGNTINKTKHPITKTSWLVLLSLRPLCHSLPAIAFFSVAIASAKVIAQYTAKEGEHVLCAL